MTEPTWRTEYPTEPGFYWLRNYVLDTWRGDEAISGPEIVQVDKEGDFRRIDVETTTFKHWVLSAEWFGPIQPPADNQDCACYVDEDDIVIHRNGCIGDICSLGPGAIEM